MAKGVIQVNTSASYYAEVARIEALDEVERLAASGRPFSVVPCVSWTDKTPLSTVDAIKVGAEVPVKNKRRKTAEPAE